MLERTAAPAGPTGGLHEEGRKHGHQAHVLYSFHLTAALEMTRSEAYSLETAG
jgi:hypothetical protein